MAAQSRGSRLPVSLGARPRTNSAHARRLDQRPEFRGLSEFRSGLESRDARVGIGHWPRGADLRFEAQSRPVASIRAGTYRELPGGTDRSPVRSHTNKALRRRRSAYAGREIADRLHSTQEWSLRYGPLRPPETTKHHDGVER